VTKVLASLLLSLCLCVPGWAEKDVAHLDSNAAQELQRVIRDIQIQIPELLKALRINLPEIQVQIPEITVQVPEILIPAIRLQTPVDVQIPEIQLPEIRIEIPKINVQIAKPPQ